MQERQGLDLLRGDTNRFLPLDDFDPIEDVAVLPVVAEKRIGPLAASRMI